MEEIIAVETDEAEAPEGESPDAGAGFLPRASAQFLDLILHGILWLVGVFVMMVLLYLWAEAASGFDLERDRPRIAFLLMEAFEPRNAFILMALGYVLYHTLCEGLHGATLGKLALGLHVVGEDGDTCGFAGALVRSTAWILDMLFFGLVAALAMRASPLRQRLGDRWAGTVVIQRASYPDLPMPAGGIFAWTLLAALALNGLLMLVAIFLPLFFDPFLG